MTNILPQPAIASAIACIAWLLRLADAITGMPLSISGADSNADAFKKFLLCIIFLL
jgi:hypothetical protein